MKRFLIVIATIALSISALYASPVELNRAKHYGESFVHSALGRSSAALELVYTEVSSSGQPCLYVFNYDHGYVIIAADDVAQPVLAYSEDECFPVDNMPEGMRYYLGHYANQISFAVEHRLEAEEQVAAQWRDLSWFSKERSQKGVPAMINLNWDQSYPYNYYCPGSGTNHAYAGCLADAMAMVMKFWNWPDHGEGSHSYTPANFPGQVQSADFENTYYDWDNMPVSLSYGSPLNQIQAVALLMWHCGIAVDMDYAYSGSGSHIEYVPGVISDFFRYTNQAKVQSRENYTRTQWEDMLIAVLDQGFPCVYAGVDATQGGHAFVCDGYNDNRYFHFNWGWSGSGNNYYAIDALNPPGYPYYQFNQSQRVVVDFVPKYLFDEMTPEVEDFKLMVENANSKTGVISWTNPAQSITGQPLESIEKVVLMRDGTEIFSAVNVAPGETMSYTDAVPEYDSYKYVLYFITNGIKGRFNTMNYQYGPTCTWKIITQTTNFQGWNGGKLQVLNEFDHVFTEITMTSSVPASQPIEMPLGNFKLVWVAPLNTVQNLSFNLKNSSNQSVYNFSGNSNSLSAGELFAGENDCDGCLPPTDFTGTYQWTSDGFGALLSWNYGEDPQSFKVYRSADGIEYEEVATVEKEARQYFDVNTPGSCYYKVTAYRSYCESLPAWTPGELSDYVQVEITAVGEEHTGIKVFPNPVKERLSITGDHITQVVIHNVLGQTVYQFHGDVDMLEVATDDLASGVYILSVSSDEGNAVLRIVRQ